MVDVGGLYDCLMAITGKAGHEILDRYNTIRREKYRTVINPISSENFERLWKRDPEKVLETDRFLQLRQRAFEDKELSASLQLVCFEMFTLFIAF